MSGFVNMSKPVAMQMQGPLSLAICAYMMGALMTFSSQRRFDHAMRRLDRDLRELPDILERWAFK